MKILLVGGFLGSGKTSFILKLAHHMVEDLGMSNIVILENEIGEISVDDKVLKGSGYQVKGLFAGCVCCTLAGELPVTINEIHRDIDPEWLIMEATGVAFPYNIRENLEANVDIPCTICCITDAKRWNRLLKPMERLLTHQLKDAKVIFVNKADLVDADTLQQVIESVRSFNDTAEIAAVCASESIDTALLDKLLN